MSAQGHFQTLAHAIAMSDPRQLAEVVSLTRYFQKVPTAHIATSFDHFVGVGK